MKASALPKKVFQKRIPTILGLVVLVVALVAGTLMLGDGPGVFAPRATPETTPKQVKITNVTDRSFTVSFLTEEATTGYVKFGSDPQNLDSQSSDNRDQVSGTVGEYKLHYITVRGLSPAASYYFLVGSNNNNFDNNGAPFSVTTASRTGAPPAARTISGSVNTPNGAPAEGSVVYVTAQGMEEMSSLVSSSGSWAVPLSDARTAQGQYAQIDDSQAISILAQGTSPQLVSNITSTVGQAHPLPTITLGSSQIAEAPEFSLSDEGVERGADVNPSTLPPEQPGSMPPEEVSDSSNSADLDNADINDSGTTANEASTSSKLSEEVEKELELTEEEKKKLVVDMESEDEQIIETSKPKIVGKAAPSTPIRIIVNSETQIETELITDENGDFELDLSQFEDELEPGEHSVTIHFNDPATGQDVTKTYNFIVAAVNSLATGVNAQENQQTSGEQPFGTDNPVPIDPTPTPTLEPTLAPTATPSATPGTGSAEATRTAKVSTESSLPKAGSVGTTMALVFGGLFFIISGAWSFWISNQLEKPKA